MVIGLETRPRRGLLAFVRVECFFRRWRNVSEHIASQSGDVSLQRVRHWISGLDVGLISNICRKGRLSKFNSLLWVRFFEVILNEAPRSSTKWFALVFLFFFSVQSSKPTEAASVVATESISPDCSAFKKDADGKWIVTRRSDITGSVSGPEPVYPGLNLDMMRPNGLNLVDALNKKCGR